MQRRHLLAAAAALVRPAHAQAPQPDGPSVTIAFSTNVTSIDPHFHNAHPNRTFSVHLFDRLVQQDSRQRVVPGLATRWRAVDPTTWEFVLRPGVRFHDREPFGPEDVLASLRRAGAVPNSPSSFGIYTKPIVEAWSPDPGLVMMRTAAPYPLLPIDLTNVNIIARRHEAASTADFNAGRAAIGTGPFRLVSWRANDRLELERYDGYWAGPPAWRHASLRIITNDGARVASLLARDVDVVDVVPIADVERLRSDPGLHLERSQTTRLIYAVMDQHRDVSPFIRGNDGQPLARNPLRDRRVRRALSMSLNREALTRRVLHGMATPAGDIIPPGFFGSSPDRRPIPYDPDGARRLLAEAGYPQGFQLTMHGPNGAFSSDGAVAQSVAQMLTRVGVKTDLELLPWSNLVARGTRLELSFFITPAGAPTGEASIQLRMLMASFNADSGLGTLNRGRYANAEYDARLARAMTEMDDARREAMFRDIAALGLDDDAILPIYFQVNAVGVRRGIAYTPRTDEQIWAHELRPASSG